MAESTIDRNSPYPYYYQLREHLREKIENGVLRPGEKIRTESELCQEFGISRIVVRQALQDLTNEGFLYRIRGKGTFVSQPKISQKVTMIESFATKMQLLGHQTSTKVLSQETTFPSPKIVKELGIDADEQVYRIVRLRYVDDEPIVLQTVFLPMNYFPGLLEHNLELSLTQLFEQQYGLKLSSYHVFMEPTLADRSEARILKVKTGSPLMLIWGISHSKDHQPIRYSKNVYRSDRLTFMVEGFSIESIKE